MNAKQYLSKLSINRLKIEQLKQQIDELEDTLCSVKAAGYSVDKVKATKSNNAYNAVDKLIDLKEETEKEIAAATEFRLRSINQIQQLSSDRYIAMLYDKYVEELEYKEIHYKTRWSYRAMFDIHKKALTEFENKFSELLQ